MPTTPFYTFDLLRDMAGDSCATVYDSSLGEHFDASLNDTDYLVETAHAPGGKPLVINLQRKHCVLPRPGWGWYSNPYCYTQPTITVCDSNYVDSTGDTTVYCQDLQGGSVCDSGYGGGHSVPGQVSFRVNSSMPRHASALYLAANSSGLPDSCPVAPIMVRFQTPSRDTVTFDYMLTHRRDLRNWSVGDTNTPLPVAPLDSNSNWHQLDSGDGHYMDVVRIPFPDSLLPAGGCS